MAHAACTLQLDAFQGHRHDVSIDVGRSTGIVSPGGSGADVPNGTVPDPITDGTNGVPRTANETRLLNIAVTYCVRKNS